MADAYIYDVSTNVGLVRLNIADIDDSDVSPATARASRTMLFTDAEIGAFLTAAGDNVDRASSRALLAIASSKALLEKRVSIEGLDRDTQGIAKELRAQAKEFETRGIEGDHAPTDELVHQDWTDFAYQQRIVDEQLEELA